VAVNDAALSINKH